MALSRLEYQSDNATVTYHSDKPTGPTAGSETMDVAELLRRIFEVDPLECPRCLASLTVDQRGTYLSAVEAQGHPGSDPGCASHALSQG